MAQTNRDWRRMMGRPRTWYKTSEYNVAKKMAKNTNVKLYKFARPTRGNGVETGYYVGDVLPTRLTNAEVEQKNI